VKVKEGDKPTRYDFVYTDKDGFERIVPGLSRTFEEDFWNYSIIISGILRYGTMPIQETIYMISKLKLKNDDAIGTWKDGVIRALKKYIPNGTVVEKEKCPECREPTLVYENGCVTCKSCGYSKCG
jgi:ribonucleoside-diphosphate reductase alpha chain